MPETPHPQQATAIIANTQTEQRASLRAWHSVGRSRSCALHLDRPHISKQHALIVWNGEYWSVRDLHSRNGTWLNHSRIQPGQDIPLTTGMILAFGSQDEQWEIRSLGAPTACVRSISDHSERSAHNDLLPLPSAEAPEAVLLVGPDGDWLLERSDGSTQPIEDRDQFDACGDTWTVFLPEPVDETFRGTEHPTPDTITLWFTPRSGKGPQVGYQHKDQRVTLPARVHQKLLLELARARLRDQQEAELPEAEHGWLYRDQLGEQLNLPGNRLYVYVYRARAQLADAGVFDAAGVIERRSDTHQIRIGVSKLQIS